MKLGLLVVVACIAAADCYPVAARDSLTLEPSSNWELDYEADSCALRRMFGEGEQQTQLEMRRFQPGIGLQIAVASKTRMIRRNVRYRFGGEGEWITEAYPLFAYFNDKFEGVIFSNPLFTLPLDKEADSEARSRFFIENDVRVLETEAAAKLDSLAVAGAFRDDLVLRTGSLKAPIAALNECVDELTTHWGIDVEAHRTRTRSAVPLDLTKASRMIGYPPKMAQKGLPGLVNIRLDIDETGRVTGCHIQMPLSDPAFEESSCADIQHAFEFEPALDKDGQPMKSYYVTSVRFQIGETRYYYYSL